ncbi:MAG TPA: hypothetical protein K8V35_05760 [Aliicoccus persicus]|uniref:Uncharacterized protein n=1 Tax=Aliicoccus persicus TaxID=930138 RepID=A0A921DX77_9STAP|nr:hypothetical protein [Aliicoccus persicus]
MNFRDYQRIMKERDLITTIAAEDYLLSAMKYHDEIKECKERENIPRLNYRKLEKEYEQKKDRCILKAIEESIPRTQMELPSYWEKRCVEYRMNMYEAGIFYY